MSMSVANGNAPTLCIMAELLAYGSIQNLLRLFLCFFYQVSLCVFAVCMCELIKRVYVKVNVRASLYHGRENLCASINSPEKRYTQERTIEWHERLCFDLKLCDIPRMMRLCFMLYTAGDRRTRPVGKSGRLPTGGKAVRGGDGRKVIILAFH